MKLLKVQSSAIGAIGYDDENNTLAVMFPNRAVYFYVGVPSRLFEEFVAAESKGGFFAKEVKDQYSSFSLEETEVFPKGAHAAIVSALESIHGVVAI